MNYDRKNLFADLMLVITLSVLAIGIYGLTHTN